MSANSTIHVAVSSDDTINPRVVTLAPNGTLLNSYVLDEDVVPSGLIVDHAGCIYVANEGFSDCVLIVLDKNGSTLLTVKAD